MKRLREGGKPVSCLIKIWTEERPHKVLRNFLNIASLSCRKNIMSTNLFSAASGKRQRLILFVSPCIDFYGLAYDTYYFQTPLTFIPPPHPLIHPPNSIFLQPNPSPSLASFTPHHPIRVDCRYECSWRGGRGRGGGRGWVDQGERACGGEWVDQGERACERASVQGKGR